MSSHPATSLLRNRNFVLLWCAYFISAAGDHLSEMAILKTQNALDEGVDITPMQARMTFLFCVPFFLCGPLMGYLADRFSRRRLMILADLVRMGLMAGFAGLIAWFTPVSAAWGPYIPLLIVGLFAAMFSPARSALLPTLIDTEELVPANALIRGVGVLATTVSLLLGGWLAKHYHPQFAFQLDAASFAGSALCVYFIRPPAMVHRAGSAHSGVFDDLVGGFRYAARHRRVQQIFVIGAVFWLSAATVRSIVPALVKSVYHRPNYLDIGLFEARMVAGMVVGAVLLALLRDALRSEIAITWSLLGAGFSALILAGSALVELPVAVAFHCGGAAVIGLGFFGSALIASYNAILQRIVPDRYTGRVFGVLDVCTDAGLLLATGLLGIPDWPQLDRWAGHIALGVALLMLITGAVMMRVRLTTAPHARRLNLVANFNEFLCRFWYRLKREGICTVPRSGAVIVAASHTASPDPLMITAACRHRKISFLIAEEYADIPVARWFVRLIHCIPVKRDGTDLAGTKAAIRRLREGDALGIFIEGRIPAPGETVEPKEGVALLALKTGATVIPVHLSGNLYRDGIAQGFFARHRTTIRFGAPVDLSDFPADASREEIHDATRRIFAAIQHLGADQSRDRKGADESLPPAVS